MGAGKVTSDSLSNRKLADKGGTSHALTKPDYQAVHESLNAEPTKKIGWFDDLGTGNETYRFLSNFYIGAPIQFTVNWRGAEISLAALTGEHLFQAFKAINGEDFLAILSARYGEKDELPEGVTAGDPSPAKAKAFGRSIKLRSDWDAIRFDVMAFTVRLKTMPGREEHDRLLATGDALLQEGSWWNDAVWGVDLQDPDRPGRNWLGTLLMARRAELRAAVNGSELHPTEQYNLIYAGLAF